MTVILEGKVKSIEETHDPQEILCMFIDKVTAGNGAKEATLEGKGEVCCSISELLFKKLEDHGVDTHLLRRIDETTLLCDRVSIVPIEVVVRNKATGGLCRETTIMEGITLQYPLIEFYLKDDAKNDPLLTKDRMALMGYSHILVDKMEAMAITTNQVLRKLFNDIGLTLVDFKLEFGFSKKTGHLLLADELSPDGMRLWKGTTMESMDKDLFRKDKGNVVESYQKILDDLKSL